MIEFKNGGLKAVDNISATIEEGHVFGLIGTNGAGKSTLLRLLAGVLKADSGSVTVDGEGIYDNPAAKAKLFYISDEQYFYKNGTPRDMLRLYQTYYSEFDRKKWEELTGKFGLDVKRKINTFSKGMKKQLSVTFDGLDPVMRQAVKSLFAHEIEARGMTPIIASHNLRELEDICEYVGLLHKGGILFEKDLDEMKLNIHKIQCVVKEEAVLELIRRNLEVVTMDNRGALYTLTVRGGREKVEEFMEQLNLVFYELLPLSLEEIFISETEVKGYDIKALIL